MRLKKLIKLGSKGDTIIEILLSIAVLSLVLSVSYGLANRNSQAYRQAQERGEAQKLAEEQLELLRGYVTPDQPWESNLCFRQDNPSTPANEAVPTSNQDHCNDRGLAERYNLRVIPSGENTFTVEVDWENVKGGEDRLSLSYKIPVTGDIFATPNTQCSDGLDNAGPDNLIDAEDPDCHTDGNPDNDDSYDPTIDNEDPVIPPPPTTFTLTVSNPGNAGRISGSGINCGRGNSDCTETYEEGTSVSLNASAASSYVFDDWSPTDCRNFTINTNKICEADFIHLPRTALYRCYQHYVGGTSHGARYVTDHFYTTNSNACHPNISSTNWWIVYEGIVGYVPTGGPYSRSAVYGGWDGSFWFDSFYTTNYQEYVNAHYAGWYNNSGFQGWYVYPSWACNGQGNNEVPDAAPLHRFWSSYVGDHFYTRNYSEGAGAGYQYEGVFGCIFTSS